MFNVVVQESLKNGDYFYAHAHGSMNSLDEYICCQWGAYSKHKTNIFVCGAGRN